MRPNRMSGEELTTHFLAALIFLGEFFGSFLKRRYIETRQTLQEFLAAHSSKFGGFTLRDQSHFVPFDCRGEAHFAHKFFWCAS